MNCRLDLTLGNDSHFESSVMLMVRGAKCLAKIRIFATLTRPSFFGGSNGSGRNPSALARAHDARANSSRHHLPHSTNHTDRVDPRSHLGARRSKQRQPRTPASGNDVCRSSALTELNSYLKGQNDALVGRRYLHCFLFACVRRELLCARQDRKRRVLLYVLRRIPHERADGRRKTF